MTVYSNPYGGYPGDGGDIAGALGAYFGCVAIFSLLIVALYLWLFYRILTKAGYSGWLTLLNLVPLGSIGLIFWLAFADWPALQNRGAGPMMGGPTYPTAYPPAQQPMPPSGPGYQPPSPPMAQPPVPPVEEPPVQQRPPMQEPPVQQPPVQEPPAPPAPVAEEPPSPPIV